MEKYKITSDELLFLTVLLLLQDGEDDYRQSFVDKATFEDLHKKCRSIVKSAKKIGLNMGGCEDGEDMMCMDSSWLENEKILEICVAACCGCCRDGCVGCA